jgi:hypothetical protein
MLLSRSYGFYDGVRFQYFEAAAAVRLKTLVGIECHR